MRDQIKFWSTNCQMSYLICFNIVISAMLNGSP
jgi:hypothetical protein